MYLHEVISDWSSHVHKRVPLNGISSIVVKNKPWLFPWLPVYILDNVSWQVHISHRKLQQNVIYDVYYIMHAVYYILHHTYMMYIIV